MNPLIWLVAFQVCWQNPTHNTDETPLNDLKEVVVYIGSASRQYDYRTVVHPTTEPGGEVCTNIKVAPGTYYVAATAIDEEGNESAFSNEGQVTETRGLDTPSGGRLETPTGGRVITDE